MSGDLGFALSELDAGMVGLADLRAAVFGRSDAAVSLGRLLLVAAGFQAATTAVADTARTLDRVVATLAAAAATSAAAGQGGPTLDARSPTAPATTSRKPRARIDRELVS